MDQFETAQDMERWDFVGAVKNIRVPKNAGYFLTI